jgi:hypothetical protein
MRRHAQQREAVEQHRGHQLPGDDQGDQRRRAEAAAATRCSRRGTRPRRTPPSSQSTGVSWNAAAGKCARPTHPACRPSPAFRRRSSRIRPRRPSRVARGDRRSARPGPRGSRLPRARAAAGRSSEEASCPGYRMPVSLGPESARPAALRCQTPSIVVVPVTGESHRDGGSRARSPGAPAEAESADGSASRPMISNPNRGKYPARSSSGGTAPAAQRAVPGRRRHGPASPTAVPRELLRDGHRPEESHLPVMLDAGAARAARNPSGEHEPAQMLSHPRGRQVARREQLRDAPQVVRGRGAYDGQGRWRASCSASR